MIFNAIKVHPLSLFPQFFRLHFIRGFLPGLITNLKLNQQTGSSNGDMSLILDNFLSSHCQNARGERSMRGGLAEQIANYFLLGSSFLFQLWASSPLVIKVPSLKASASFFWEYVILLRCLIYTYTYIRIYLYTNRYKHKIHICVHVYIYIYIYTHVKEKVQRIFCEDEGYLFTR